MTNAYVDGGAVGEDGKPLDVGMDIFQRGVCLPSDNKMRVEEQDRIIEVIHGCFK
jgi:dTDP-4-amino-4,6-dideoxygalactose transaminase